MGGAKLKGHAQVLVVRDIEESADFYKRLGFSYELVGGPEIQHVHMIRDHVTFILHQTANQEEIRPFSSLEGGLYFDAFCFAADGADLRQLLEEVESQGIEIVQGPDLNEVFSEFTIRDLDGYRIAFGG